MIISIIGSNGLLSNALGHFYNKKDYSIDIYGLNEPKAIHYNHFYKTDLTTCEIDYQNIIESDIIIYAAGAGIQSNLNESNDLIYNLNVFAPVKICMNLSSLNYNGIFISFGSYFEIGETNENKKYKEEDIISSLYRVPNTYCISKRMLTRFVSSFYPKFTYWHFILPTIYGEKENPQRLIPYVINAFKNNKEEELSFTSGNQIRQYIYINEVAHIIDIACSKMLPSGIYNIAGNETLTVKELVKMIYSFYNKTFDEKMFGKAQRHDIGMQILKLDDNKLYNNIKYQSKIKIKDVYKQY